jgi:hypothetical protein
VRLSDLEKLPVAEIDMLALKQAGLVSNWHVSCVSSSPAN